MLNVREILQNLDEVIKELNKRGGDHSYLSELTDLDKQRREVITRSETVQAQINSKSKEIGKAKGKGESVEPIIAEVSKLKNQIAGDKETITSLDEKIASLLMKTPNLPLPTIPVGTDEADNKEIKKVGDVTHFDFKHKPHWELMSELDIVEQDRATKMSGSRFIVYKGDGAKLERALINFMLNTHTDNGYVELMPPVVVEARALRGTGQLPKFEEDLFKIEGTSKYLIPTAEVPVTYFHADETIDSSKLPVKYTAYTPCFRSEAGASGRDVKGVIRLHQFNKVEIVKLVKPEDGLKELDLLLNDAEGILKALELPYRVIDLCTGDIGFSAQKTYDIEVWLPSYDAYKEISSCSVFGQFQARRSNIKFKDGKKKDFVTTINGSGLAVGRTFAAILENYQNADGTITVPKVLRPYMGGQEIIKKL